MSCPDIIMGPTHSPCCYARAGPHLVILLEGDQSAEQVEMPTGLGIGLDMVCSNFRRGSGFTCGITSNP